MSRLEWMRAIISAGQFAKMNYHERTNRPEAWKAVHPEEKGWRVKTLGYGHTAELLMGIDQ